MGNSVSALELKAQWRKPTDIFNILLVVGGDIVRMAYAQLSGRWICPVPLSFGAVAFAYNLLFITFGKGQLMPSNDTPCLVINLEEGNSRECRSWVLGRLWRDHEYWMDDRVRAKLEKVITAKTDTMKENIRVKSRVRQPEHNAPPKPRQSSQGVPAKDLEVQSGELDIENFRRVPQAGLVISVYELLRTEPPKRTDVRPGFPTPFTLDIKWDSAYLSGIITILLQVFVAIMAWLHVDGQGSHPDQGSWAILMITLVGITLSLLIGILPRWEKEKWACRRETKSKVIGLTTGQGAQHLIVFYTPEPEPDEKGQVLNLEDLATGTVSEPSGRGLKALVLMLVLLYTAILICATAVKEDTWYLLAIGGLGMAQNFFAAGKSRKPEHFGISCRYRETFADQKVHAAIFEFMATWDQKCGKNLFPLFFTNGIDGLRKGERETLEEIEKGQRHVKGQPVTGTTVDSVPGTTSVAVNEASVTSVAQPVLHHLSISRTRSNKSASRILDDTQPSPRGTVTTEFQGLTDRDDSVAPSIDLLTPSGTDTQSNQTPVNSIQPLIGSDSPNPSK